ncbi:MAG: hypothetical protein WAQ98_18120 [Blastocatellia bacterium]
MQFYKSNLLLAGIPTSDTGAVVRTLIKEIAVRIILVNHAIHNGE